MICGRKRPLTLNLASMLRKMDLPDNVARQIFPQIFLGLTRKSVAKKSLGGLAILCVRNSLLRAGKTATFARADGHGTRSPNISKLFLLTYNQARPQCWVLDARL